jgi:hypothetical protein
MGRERAPVEQVEASASPPPAKQAERERQAGQACDRTPRNKSWRAQPGCYENEQGVDAGDVRRC